MKLRGLFLATLALSAAFASAEIFTDTLTLGGATSVDGLYDPDNTDVSFDLGAIYTGYSNFTLIGIGWDVEIETVGASWLSELVLSIEATSAEFSGLNFVDTNPGFGDDFSGTASYNSGGLLTIGTPVVFDPDNLMRVHIWELFDDAPGAIDAEISGTYTLQFEATAPVPEPASMAVLGFGALALLRKRRK